MTTNTIEATMVSLSIGAWTGRKADRSLAEMTESNVGAEKRSMNVIKRLTPANVLNAVTAAEQAARKYHTMMTVPGIMGGRMVAHGALYDYTQKMSDLKNIFHQEVAGFMDHYPTIVAEAPKRLGDAFNEKDFPTEREIKARFHFTVDFYPLPSMKDWRIPGLDPETAASIKKNAEEALTAAFEEGVSDLLERAKEHLEKIVGQLTSANGLVYQPTIDNLREFASLLPKINVTKSPDVDRLASDIQMIFAKQDAERLRCNSDERKKIAALVAKIMPN